MLFIVLLISYLVQIYSFKYMYFDPHLIRFIAYLLLFTFFMLILIVSENLLIFFCGWEGVGLCSYLLISFWFSRIKANKSALKAVFVNRISDFLLTFGLVAIFNTFLCLDFSSFFALSSFFQKSVIYIFNFSFLLISFISFFLYCGAVGKSAQIFLHT